MHMGFYMSIFTVCIFSILTHFPHIQFLTYLVPQVLAYFDMHIYAYFRILGI